MPILPCRQTDHDGKSRRTAELIGELAESVTESRLHVLHLVRDEIPDIRRSRRRTRTTKVEKIMVLRKRDDSIHTVDEESAAVCDRPARKPKPASRRGSHQP
jgi:Mg2+ and Co2+ transporter CorA